MAHSLGVLFGTLDFAAGNLILGGVLFHFPFLLQARWIEKRCFEHSVVEASTGDAKEQKDINERIAPTRASRQGYYFEPREVSLVESLVTLMANCANSETLESKV